MNEPIPHYPDGVDVERYKKGVLILLDQMFALLPVQTEERVEIPHDVEYRSWQLESSDRNHLMQLSVMRASAAARSLKAEDVSNVTMFRAYSDNTENTIETRIYQYSLLTGDLQVFNDVSTEKQAQSYRIGSPEADRYRQGVTEGMAMHVFTASDNEYLDFLQDLQSYQKTFES